MQRFDPHEQRTTPFERDPNRPEEVLDKRVGSVRRDSGRNFGIGDETDRHTKFQDRPIAAVLKQGRGREAAEEAGGLLEGMFRNIMVECKFIADIFIAQKTMREEFDSSAKDGKVSLGVKSQLDGYFTVLRSIRDNFRLSLDELAKVITKPQTSNPAFSSLASRNLAKYRIYVDDVEKTTGPLLHERFLACLEDLVSLISPPRSPGSSQKPKNKMSAGKMGSVKALEVTPIDYRGSLSPASHDYTINSDENPSVQNEGPNAQLNQRNQKQTSNKPKVERIPQFRNNLSFGENFESRQIDGNNQNWDKGRESPEQSKYGAESIQSIGGFNEHTNEVLYHNSNLLSYKIIIEVK